MPQIPTFTATGSLPAEPDRTYVNPQAMAAPGIAAERLGQSVEGLGDQLDQLKQRSDYIYVADNAADATVKLNDAARSKIEKAQQTGDYQGLTQGIRQQVDQDLQQRLANAPSDIAAAHLKRHFATLTEQLTSTASSAEHQLAAQVNGATRRSAFEDFQKQAGLNPAAAPGLYAQGRGLIAGAAAAGLLSPEQQQNEEQALGNSVIGAAVRQRAISDPGGLAADWEVGKYTPYLDEATIERLAPLVSNAKATAAGREIYQQGAGAVGIGAGNNSEIASNNFAGMRVPGVLDKGGPLNNPSGWQRFATPEDGVSAISR
ncbi:MAG TPA: hypothetical protein VHY35_07270 [Stellaceae bacterium]|jgi:hypothetical protein|nr:hypothetical protein [Stellaceae bacterium]